MKHLLSKTVPWIALIVASSLLAAVLHWARVPAAMMLGPLLTGVGFALCGVRLAVSGQCFSVAQAIVGCMVAVTITPDALAALVQNWPVMILAVFLVIFFGALVEFCLMRFGSLEGSTAAWGVSPGGASAMTVLAESYGADIRMVAFMQYLRVLVVVLTASGISRLLLGHAVAAPVHSWSPGFDTPLWPLVQTLGLAVGGGAMGRLLRLPAGAMLVPMVAGAVFHSLGVLDIVHPNWLLWTAYALLGWYIGLRFTQETLRYAMRALPQLLLSIAALMALCGLAAWMLHVLAGVDALSAYLATSPGGMDSVVVIAAGSGGDVPFVLSLQTLRLFAVILAGPLVAKLVCRLGGCDSAASEPDGEGDS